MLEIELKFTMDITELNNLAAKPLVNSVSKVSITKDNKHYVYECYDYPKFKLKQVIKSMIIIR